VDLLEHIVVVAAFAGRLGRIRDGFDVDIHYLTVLVEDNVSVFVGDHAVTVFEEDDIAGVVDEGWHVAGQIRTAVAHTDDQR